VKAVTKRVSSFHAKNDKIFKRIKNKLIASLIFLLPLDMEAVRKRDLSLKSRMHFYDMYSNCLHAPVAPPRTSKWPFNEDHSKRHLFQALLPVCADCPLQVNSFQTTQANKWFIHLKARYLEKGKKWAASQKMCFRQRF
jgi:hypothetical protein